MDGRATLLFIFKNPEAQRLSEMITTLTMVKNSTIQTRFPIWK